MFYSSEDILRILPHRYPFLFIDKAERLSSALNYPNRVGTKVKAIKCVSINEPHMAGHFPHRPVLPGIVMLESIAQASILACYRPEDVEQEVAIAAINNAKFRAPIVPGDLLEILVEVVKDKGAMMLIEGQVFRDKKLVAEAQLLAHMFPKK